jgi:hypothetical protein
MKWAKKKSDQLAVLMIVGAALILLVHYFRDGCQFGSTLTFLLGVAPNFIAAFCLPPVFLVNKNVLDRYIHDVSKFSWFVTSTLLCLVILLAWEIRQIYRADFVFDWYDIIANIVGAILFLLSWPVVKPYLDD